MVGTGMNVHEYEQPPENGYYQRHDFKSWLGVLPGRDWLIEHEHDLDGWQPEIAMNLGGVRYNIRTDAKTLGKVMKVNKGAMR